MAIAGSKSPLRNRLITTLSWFVALIMFFPIFWVLLTSIKDENSASSPTPEIIPTLNRDFIEERNHRLERGLEVSIFDRLYFYPTTENYVKISRAPQGFWKFLINTAVISVGATLIGMLLAVPAAYSMAFKPSRWTKDILLWMLSTKMLPAVGVVVPIYLLFKGGFSIPYPEFFNEGGVLSIGWLQVKLLDTRAGLIMVLSLINLPILIWILYIYFKEVPKEILEASRMDGASTWGELRQIVLPLAWGGIASCALLSIIFSWNEAYWTIKLATSESSGLASLVSSTIQNRELYTAKLSAASMVAIAPIIVMGWFSQKQLVAGLSFGAVK